MKKKRLLFLILLLMGGGYSYAQTLSVDELMKAWRVTDTSQTRAAGDAVWDMIAHPDKEKFLSIALGLNNRSLNGRLRIRAYMYQSYGYGLFGIKDTITSKTYCLRMLKEAALLGDEQLLSEMYIIYGGMCVPEESIYYLLKASEIQESHRISSEYMYGNYAKLSLLSYEFMLDYESSARYAALGVSMYRKPDLDLHNFILLLDIAGDSYIKLNMPDSAIYYYQMIRRNIARVKLFPIDFSPKLSGETVKIWDNIALGGIARAFILKAQFDTAYTLLLQNLRSSVDHGEMADASLVQSALAHIDYIRKDLSSAAKRYSLARQWATSNKRDILLSDALEGGAKAFAALGRYDSAYFYQKEYLLLKANLEAGKYESKIEMAKAQVRYDGIQALVDQTRNEIARQKMLRTIILGGVFLLGVIGVLLYNSNRLKHNLRQTELEKQKQLAESEAELARRNIVHAQDQLAEVVNNISEKNKLIEGLENRLAENEKIDLQEVLRNFTIITGNDWLKFKDYFEKAYPNYWERLHHKLPNLTQSDERLLTLIKLQLGNKEIGAATGISAESVRVSVHRLRKKIEAFYPDISLEEFTATL
ncbi:MAG: hypothetical protein V4539_23115 [Bacteroidota bacterium]